MHLTLLLGAVLRRPSLLDLSLKSRKPGLQRLIDHGAISHAALGYALEHGRPADWRELVTATLRQLKANKGLDSTKLGGLLVVAVDATSNSIAAAAVVPIAPNDGSPFWVRTLGRRQLPRTTTFRYAPRLTARI